jgi:hypothetical protein
MDPCALAVIVRRKKALMSQMAMLQLSLHCRISCTFDTFWQGLARHGTTALGVIESSNTYACAKLVSQHHRASTRQQVWACRLSQRCRLHAMHLRDLGSC